MPFAKVNSADIFHELTEVVTNTALLRVNTVLPPGRQLYVDGESPPIFTTTRRG
jgi:hypothetical protein